MHGNFARGPSAARDYARPGVSFVHEMRRVLPGRATMEAPVVRRAARRRRRHGSRARVEEESIAAKGSCHLLSENPFLPLQILHPCSPSNPRLGHNVTAGTEGRGGGGDAKSVKGRCRSGEGGCSSEGCGAAAGAEELVQGDASAGAVEARAEEGLWVDVAQLIHRPCSRMQAACSTLNHEFFSNLQIL